MYIWEICLAASTGQDTSSCNRLEEGQALSRVALYMAASVAPKCKINGVDQVIPFGRGSLNEMKARSLKGLFLDEFYSALQNS